MESHKHPLLGETAPSSGSGGWASGLAWAAGVQALVLGVGIFGWTSLVPLNATLFEAPLEERTPGDPEVAVVEPAGDPGQPPAPEAPSAADPVAEPLPEPEPLPALPEIPQIPPPPPLAQLDLVEPLPAPEIREPEPEPDREAERERERERERLRERTAAQERERVAAEARRNPRGGSGRSGGAEGGGGAGPVRAFTGGGGRFPQPDYPSDARRAGAEGTVMLQVLVGGNGRPESVDVVASSGNASLDRAAVRGVRRWRWDDGPARYQVPVRFRLE